MYQVTPIPAFDDNYIWMLHNSKQAVVVDPGDASVVVTALEKQGKTLSAILITHHHSDHTGGVDALVEQYKVPVYGPHNCNYQGITVPLKDADKIIVMGAEFEIKAIPGHTLDHICYFNNHSQQPQIFCGDTLFLAGCGRLFEGSMPQMLAAMEYFKTLPDETQVYCAHEYSLSNLVRLTVVQIDSMTIAVSKKEHTPRRPGAVPGWPVNVLSTPRGVLSLDDASLMFNLCDRLYRNGMTQNEIHYAGVGRLRGSQH